MGLPAVPPLPVPYLPGSPKTSSTLTHTLLNGGNTVSCGSTLCSFKLCCLCASPPPQHCGSLGGSGRGKCKKRPAAALPTHPLAPCAPPKCPRGWGEKITRGRKTGMGASVEWALARWLVGASHRPTVSWCTPVVWPTQSGSGPRGQPLAPKGC